MGFEGYPKQVTECERTESVEEADTVLTISDVRQI